jgi:hypothetical protein
MKRMLYLPDSTNQGIDWEMIVYPVVSADKPLNSLVSAKIIKRLNCKIYLLVRIIYAWIYAEI